MMRVNLPSLASRPEDWISDATPVRHFAVAGQFALLADVLDGVVRVPRQVFDPDDAVNDPGTLVSEIGNSERFYRRRSTDPVAMDKWSHLRSLRQRTDINVIDLSEDEDKLYTDLMSTAFARGHHLAAPLGRGEAAVIAIAITRGDQAIMDDGAARRTLNDLAPGHPVLTTREVLRVAVTERQLLTSGEAEIIYSDMLEDGYRGPPSLW